MTSLTCEAIRTGSVLSLSIPLLIIVADKKCCAAQGVLSAGFGLVIKPMEWFQRGCSFSLVVFTKKSQKLLPELWCTASKDKPPEKKNPSKNTVSST